MAGRSENKPGISIETLICVLHIGLKAEQGDIKHFDQSIWNTILNISKVCKKKTL